MPSDIFLKMDPIKGESQDTKHKDEIDIQNWSIGASQTGAFGSGGGGGAGKVSFQDLHLTHYVDRASPDLMKACATGQHFDKAVLTVRKAGGKDALEYLKITLKDVLVSSWQPGGSSHEELIPESITLNFRKIEYEYTVQTDKGGAGTSTTVTWDVAANHE